MQIRCLLEGVTPEEMLRTWHDMLPTYMQRWDLDRGEVRTRGLMPAPARTNIHRPCAECCAHHLTARLRFTMHSSLVLLLLLLLCSWWIFLAALAMIGWLLTWTAGWRPTASTLGWRRPCKH